MGCLKCDLILFPAALLYLITLITEIVSSVPLGLVQGDFGGNCMLSAEVSYNASYNFFNVTKYGSSSVCGFCTYMTVFTVLFALVYGLYIVYALYKTLENAKEMWVLPALLVNVLFLVLKFISSCIISIGSKNVCDSIETTSELKCSGIEKRTCYLVDGSKADSSKLFTYHTTAQTASWFCVLWWTILTILAILHYRRNVKNRNPDKNGLTNKNFKS